MSQWRGLDFSSSRHLFFRMGKEHWREFQNLLGHAVWVWPSRGRVRVTCRESPTHVVLLHYAKQPGWGIVRKPDPEGHRGLADFYVVDEAIAYAEEFLFTDLEKLLLLARSKE